jgi:hypothetical protein
MFEADWTPSSWDDQDSQRRHLAVDKDGKTIPGAAAPTNAKANKAATPS